MTMYHQAHNLLLTAFQAQVARRNTVSIGTEPEETLFCDFIIAAFDEGYRSWENDLIVLLNKCRSTPKQQQRIILQAQELYAALGD